MKPNNCDFCTLLIILYFYTENERNLFSIENRPVFTRNASKQLALCLQFLSSSSHVTCSSNFTNSRFYTEDFDCEISRQDQVKHSKMGGKHLIQIVTLLWRVSTKIMQQSEEQALNKRATFSYIFWLYHAKLKLVYLYSL